SWFINNWANIKAMLGIVSAETGGNMDMMGGISGISGGGQVSLVPPWLIVAAVVFGVFIGLVSGFTPANRAVKISALEAIKHD
ncbi:MAG: ABC transporter permease, partial [Hydrogenoanaerobacterium sp.]